MGTTADAPLASTASPATGHAEPSGKHAAAGAAATAKRKSIKGQVYMWITALLWGSNPVALRYLYLSAGPPSAAVLAAAQTVLAAVLLTMLSQGSKACAALHNRRNTGAEDAAEADRQTLVKPNQPSSDSKAWQQPGNTDSKAWRQTSSGSLDEYDTVPLFDPPAFIGGSAQHMQSLHPEPAQGMPSTHATSAFANHHAYQPVMAATAAAHAAHAAQAGRAGDVEQAPLQPATSVLSLETSIDGSILDAAHKGSGPVRSLLRKLRSGIARLLNSSTKDVRLAGGELGLLAFTANSLTILGFGFSSASRGAFLLRSSIVGTPVLSALAGLPVAASMWIGALVGFAGSVLISLDPTQSEETNPEDTRQAAHLALLGDIIICCAAGVWSVVMVRQSRHAPHFRAVDLAAAKLAVMAVLSSLWLGTDILRAVAHHQPPSVVWPGYANAFAWLILLWPAVGPWTTGEITQIEAQARISASHGQIILAIDPLISVAFAGLLSSSEQHLGPLGWAGGVVLITACIIASRGAVQGAH